MLKCMKFTIQVRPSHLSPQVGKSQLIGPNNKNKCVWGNRSENFSQGRHTYFFLIIFFLDKNVILCILKGVLPFKMHKIIFFQNT